MSAWDIPGQARAADVLRRAAQRGEAGHAWAFVGPRGVGQSEAALALTAALVCPEGKAGQACERCDACARVARGVHPAYQEFAATGQMHRVVDVRERWLPAAARTAGEGGWKVLRVLDADRMNEASANAFLKGLEEPPAGTLWLLDIADPDDLPDTVLSRCRQLRFKALDAETLDARARRCGIDDARERALAVRVSLGAPDRLAALAAPGALDDVRAHRRIGARLHEPGFALIAAKQIEDEVGRRTSALREAAKAERAEVAALHGDAPPRGVLKELDERQARREREARSAVVQAALDDIAAWYRDVLLVQSGGEAEVPSDELEFLRGAAGGLGAAAVFRAIDAVLETRASLELNASVRLSLEALFMRLTAEALSAR